MLSEAKPYLEANPLNLAKGVLIVGDPDSPVTALALRWATNMVPRNVGIATHADSKRLRAAVVMDRNDTIAYRTKSGIDGQIGTLSAIEALRFAKTVVAADSDSLDELATQVGVREAGYVPGLAIIREERFDERKVGVYGGMGATARESGALRVTVTKTLGGYLKHLNRKEYVKYLGEFSDHLVFLRRTWVGRYRLGDDWETDSYYRELLGLVEKGDRAENALDDLRRKFNGASAMLIRASGPPRYMQFPVS